MHPPVFVIVAPPCRLTVHRQNGLLHAGRVEGGRSQRSQPVHKTGLKGIRTQGHQHATKDIFTRNPVGQVQHFQKELFFNGSPSGNRGWPARTRQHRHQSNDDYADQWMLQIDRGARILQLRKMHYDFIQINMPTVRHRLFSVRQRECSNTEDGIQINRQKRKYPDCQDYSGPCAGPGLTALSTLSLSDTQFTDAGLVHLKEMTELQILHLDTTIARITEVNRAISSLGGGRNGHLFQNARRES